MAKQLRSSSSPLANLPPRKRTADNLSTYFTRHMPLDTPDTAELWQRYQAEDTPDNFAALCAWYAPYCLISAFMTKRRNREYYAIDTIDELVSDGTLGLIEAIRHLRDQRYHYGFRNFISKTIRRAIRRGKRGRTWPGWRIRKRLSEIEEVRSELVQDLGRLPDRKEISHKLVEKLGNPLFYPDPPDFLSYAQQDAKPAFQVADGSAPDPARRAMDKELLRLVMKGLKPTDRKILKLTLEGREPKEIGRMLGIASGRVSRRLNGALWEARCRVELAEYAGVEPAERPAAWKDRWPAISKLAPARKVG